MTKRSQSGPLRKKSDGTVWKDRKGLSFLDPANKEVWDYICSVGKTAYSVGFDEINFDYIRYPSDGNIKDINYSISEGETRASNIEEFFTYLVSQHEEGRKYPISADLFGLVTTAAGDRRFGHRASFRKGITTFRLYRSNGLSISFCNRMEWVQESCSKAL
jgi:hypothetical protein